MSVSKPIACLPVRIDGDVPLHIFKTSLPTTFQSIDYQNTVYEHNVVLLSDGKISAGDGFRLSTTSLIYFLVLEILVL
jgi:hypothetical protein